jgi:uncharacterized membrane protein YdjX (TVP38/TMEM64 family)
MTALARPAAVAGRAALVALVGGVFTTLYAMGFFELIQDADRVRAVFEALGLQAPLLYLAGYALLTPFFVPGLVFVIPGAVVWSWLPLFVLTWLGGIAAGSVGFGFARYLGRDYVAERLPPRLQRYETHLAEHGFRTVVLLRVSLYISPPGHWLLGLSPVGFPTFLLGTAIGLLPGSALISAGVVFVGGAFGEFFAAQPGEFWILAGGLVAFWIVLRRLRARRLQRSVTGFVGAG